MREDVHYLVARTALVWIVCALILLGGGGETVRAQGQIALFDTVTGQLAAGETHTYTVSGRSGEVISLSIHDVTNGLDTELTLVDGSGRLVATHDDRGYPDALNPLLEAVTLPRTEQYSIAVSAVGETSGDYQLTIMPGYGRLASVGFGSSRAQWQVVGEDVNLSVTPDQLVVGLEGARSTSSLFDTAQTPVSDFYAQVEMSVEASQSGNWQTGMTLRRDDSSDAYYVYVVNQDGQWRFLEVRAGTERLIRDWTPHPAIVAGRTQFTLGVFALGGGFDFFYDHLYVGTATDSALTGAGTIGLMVGTPSSLVTQNTFSFADLAITTPEASPAASIPPDSIRVVGDGRAMVTSLRRMLPVGADGDMVLTLTESTVQSNRAGIDLLSIGRGVRYRDFALGATVTLTANRPGSAGCGVAFRIAGEKSYTLAYFNQNGEYGLSHREDDTFVPGVYGMLPNFDIGTHHLHIIASDNTLYLYVDGQFAGSQFDTEVEGELSIAAVNFEPNTTSCRFEDMWVWAWE